MFGYLSKISDGKGLKFMLVPEEVQDTGIPHTNCTKTTSKDVL